MSKWKSSEEMPKWYGVAVYVLYFKGKVVHVGITSNLHQRLVGGSGRRFPRVHETKKSRDQHPTWQYLKWKEFSDEEALNACILEQKLQRRLGFEVDFIATQVIRVAKKRIDRERSVVCPKCKVNMKANGQSWCAECHRQYWLQKGKVKREEKKMKASQLVETPEQELLRMLREDPTLNS